MSARNLIDFYSIYAAACSECGTRMFRRPLGRAALLQSSEREIRSIFPPDLPNYVGGGGSGGSSRSDVANCRAFENFTSVHGVARATLMGAGRLQSRRFEIDKSFDFTCGVAQLRAKRAIGQRKRANVFRVAANLALRPPGGLSTS